MLTTVLAIWLACPPTADADAAPREPPWRITPDRANPYDHLDDLERAPIEWTSLPVAQVDAPEFEFLPLWDLLATVHALEASDTADAKWLRWAIETAGGRPHEAHDALVGALQSEPLSAARLAWWRRTGPPTLDTLEALLEAYEWAATPEHRTLLATTLALAHWQLSCPLALAPDGACRMPDASVVKAGATLLRREPISVERARHWTEVATKLRRKAKFASDDLATDELFAALALSAQSEAYEALLSARMPRDLDFVIEEWRHESGIPTWERTYKHQVARADESRERTAAFFASYGRCWSQLYEVHSDAIHTSAALATRAMLREATILFAAAAAFQGPLHRDLRDHLHRDNDSSGSRRCAAEDLLCDDAVAVAQRCVTIGTTRAAEAEVVGACQAILDVIADEPERVAEIVPEPRSTSVVHAPGVVGPEWL